MAQAGEGEDVRGSQWALEEPWTTTSAARAGVVTQDVRVGSALQEP